MARRFGELLEGAGIFFDTGETYLTRLPQEEQDAVLCANPMLPYCFLVAKRDLARLPNPDAEETVDRICPVIAFEDVERVHKTEGRMMELPSGLRLACFYNGRSLRAETKDVYAGLLRQEIERLSAAKSHLKEQIVQLEADLHVLTEEFPYTAESPEQLADALEEARREYRSVEEKAAELETEAERAAEEALRISAALRDNRAKAEKVERHDRPLNEFLERDARYTADLRRQREQDDFKKRRAGLGKVGPAANRRSATLITS